MPTSVLEAMAFGLPIISRPVGGLVDFFEEDKMGYLIESLDPKEYADKIVQLLENNQKMKEIGIYVHIYAKKHFMDSKVALDTQIISSRHSAFMLFSLPQMLLRISKLRSSASF